MSQAAVDEICAACEGSFFDCASEVVLRVDNARNIPNSYAGMINPLRGSSSSEKKRSRLPASS